MSDLNFISRPEWTSSTPWKFLKRGFGGQPTWRASPMLWWWRTFPTSSCSVPYSAFTQVLIISTQQIRTFFRFQNSRIRKSRQKHFPCKMAVKSIRTFLVDCDRARRCSSIRRHAPCPYSGASPRRPTQPPATVPTKELSFHACSSFRYDFSLF